MLPWFYGSALWATLSQFYWSACSVWARTRQSKMDSFTCPAVGAGCNESFSLPKCTLNFREAGMGCIRHKPLRSFQESESESSQVSWGLDLESADTAFYPWKQVTRPSHSQGMAKHTLSFFFFLFFVVRHAGDSPRGDSRPDFRRGAGNNFRREGRDFRLQCPHSIFWCEEQQRNVKSFWIFPEHVFQIPSEGWQLQRCKKEQTQWYKMEAEMHSHVSRLCLCPICYHPTGKVTW